MSILKPEMNLCENKLYNFFSQDFNSIQGGHFWGCSWIPLYVSRKAPLPKICHIYSTMVKLDTVTPYLKNI